MAISEKLRKKLEKRKAALKSGGGGLKGLIIFPEGKRRVRFLPVGNDEDFAMEVKQYYLGQEIKGVLSPDTVGLPCAITEVYEALRTSKDEDDKELAATFKPSKKNLSPAIAYKDEKGKEIDERGAQLAVLTTGMYSTLIDWMTDDDYGDFTDPKEGYDVKVKREGKTKTDTEYNMLKMNSSKLPKEYKGPYNIEEMVKAIMPTYEETQEKIAQFLGVSISDLPTSTKKSKKGEDGDKKKKKKKKS